MGHPEPPDPDVDAQFARIVAGWHEQAPTSGSDSLPPLEPPLVAAEHTDSAGVPTPASGSADPGGIPPETLAEADAWRGYSPPEVEEHFEPPDPAVPSPRDATYWLSLLGLAGGPLLTIWAAVFSGNPDPGWIVALGVLATFAGFGLLVLRGSGERDPGDNGARV